MKINLRSKATDYTTTVGLIIYGGGFLIVFNDINFTADPSSRSGVTDFADRWHRPRHSIGIPCRRSTTDLPEIAVG